MKNLKKILAILLALAMVFSLAACGGNDKPQDGGDEGDAAASDMAYVQEKGTLIVGITEFAPMDYKEKGSDEWIGFDADMAKAFAKSLGVDVEFIVIDWDNKIAELENKSIDVVWNGMTLDDGVKAAMETTNPYCNNAQVVVVPADQADQYQDEESLEDLAFAAEAGSAGERILNEKGLNVTSVLTQADAVMEVSAGTSQACVIDLLMAGAMIGAGTSYENLSYTVKLNQEEYGVGFRKGSDLAAALNQFFKDSYADGSMMEIAKTYGVQEALIEQK